MTARSGLKTETPQKHRRHRRPSEFRPHRRRFWAERVGVLMQVPADPLAPGTGTKAERLA